MRLADKVALITGAGSGIGRASATLFASEGAKVVVAGHSEDSALQTVEEIRKTGGKATSASGDVADNADAKGLVDVAVATYGGLDILMNAAGVTSRNALPEGASPEEVWDRVVEVNLKGTFLTCFHAVPEMERAGGGSVVNVSSILGLVAFAASRNAGFDPYPSSKGGVVQLTRNLAVDYAEKNVRVNCICPGYIETPLIEPLIRDSKKREELERLHPIGRLGRPEEVAYAALYLASDEAAFVTGAILPVDGGYTAQ